MSAAVKEIAGPSPTVIVFSSVSVQTAYTLTSVTVYVPGVAKLLDVFLVVSVNPLEKDQCDLIGLGVELFKKSTAVLGQITAGVMKSVVALPTTIDLLTESVQP